MLGLAKEPFDLLAIGAGDPIGLALHERLGVIACLLVHIARDPRPVVPGGAGGGLELTEGIVAAFGDVIDRGAVMDAAGCFQLLAAGTDIEIGPHIPVWDRSKGRPMSL